MITPKNLLIVRTDRIGDVVLSLPLAAVIKKRYPDCKISFLLREYTRPLAENNKYIDEILLLKTEGDKVLIVENASQLKKKKFDSVIVVYPTFNISLIVFLSGIKVRIGTGYRWYSALFNHKIYEHRKTAEKHELEYNLSLLEHLDITSINEEDKKEFSILPDSESSSKVSLFLNSLEIQSDQQIIIVHPGSGGSSVDLPLSKYRELIALITERTSFKVIITGSKAEFEICSLLVINEKVYNCAGLFSLRELIALISRASFFISNSTGPLHIAAASGINVIGFYPHAKACSAKRWGPYSDKGMVFTPASDCPGNSVEQCLQRECMNSIDMNEVFEKMEKILKLTPNTGETDV
jgi:heptosyltransferase III